MTEVIPSSQFEDLIRNATTPVLVDVYADWCGPCRAIAPEIDKLAQALGANTRVVKVNLDEARQNDIDGANPVIQIMDEHKLQGIPALMLFDGGEYKDALLGGPRPADSIKIWMEQTLGRTLTPAAPSQGGPAGPSAS